MFLYLIWCILFYRTTTTTTTTTHNYILNMHKYYMFFLISIHCSSVFLLLFKYYRFRYNTTISVSSKIKKPA